MGGFVMPALLAFLSGEPIETATAPPSVGTQVAEDLVDTVSTAAETAGDVVEKLPVYTSRVLLALAVLVVGFVLLKLGKYLIRKVSLKRFMKDPEALKRAKTRRHFISSIYSYIMVFAILAAVLWLFGVDITSILAAAGIVGVALAFGAQTLVKDLLSGLFIWGERSMAVGDLVSINDVDGTIEAISIRTTTIRNYNGNLITIPNGDIRTMTNMSRSYKRAIVNVPCPYEENQERLVGMIKEEMEKAAVEIEGIDSPPEVMSIVAFETHAVIVQVAVSCPIGEHWRVERDIRTRIKARFDKEGIIMPHFSAPKMTK